MSEDRDDLLARSAAAARVVLAKYLNQSIRCEPRDVVRGGHVAKVAGAVDDLAEAEINARLAQVLGGTLPPGTRVVVDRMHDFMRTRELKFVVVEPFVAGPFNADWT